MDARLVVLVPEEETGDRDGGHGQADENHGEVGEE